ncbi:uncharacterized protein LOC126412052 [Schistocerca serialis cubense]|uniref:uncharacterized protein LOC126412052 n=1 Tax=Schistocerca serialis cubense TaxID=2023355 RepID=UPI00214F0696|nr:uncharacterized protein LOC126412052 [Schistocerca serialis cubense]
MSLTYEESIEIILISGERSTRAVAEDFNSRHPTRQPITHSAVAKLLAKFRATGSVADKPKAGRPKSATDEATTVSVLASFSKSPQRCTRRLSQECGVSRTSILRILSQHKWHPYKIKLLRHLNEDDPDRRVQFAEWVTQQLKINPHFPYQVLFSDEANFFINGEVNKQNHRYWSDTNPHWIDASKTVDSQKVMVWCGLWGTKVAEPFFIDGTLTANGYLRLLNEEVVPSLITEDETFPEFFQHDGAPPHYEHNVRAYLDVQFPQEWIGRRGAVEWRPRSPDLTPLDFYLWGHVKALVYSVKIRDLHNLKQRIVDACGQIQPDVLVKVHQDWVRRMALTIQHNGQHIDPLL